MNRDKQFRSITEYFNMLNMIFYIIVAIPLVGFLLIYLQNKALIEKNEILSSSEFYIKIFMGIIIVGLMFAGEYFFRKKMKVDFSQFFLERKLDHYFQASLVRFIAYGGSASLAVIMLFIYYEGFFVGLYVMALFAFSFLRPTKKKIIKLGIFTNDEESTILKEDIIP